MCYIECIWREANERSITFSTSECVAPIPPSPPFPIIVYIHYIYIYFFFSFFSTLFISCTNSKVQLHLWMYFFVVFIYFFCSTHFFSIADCCWCTPECILVQIVCIWVFSLTHTQIYILFCVLYYTHTHTISWIVLLLSLVSYIYIF